MVTVTATCHNSDIRAFYTRLCQRGKSKTVALVAAMCMPPLILNAVVRDQALGSKNLYHRWRSLTFNKAAPSYLGQYSTPLSPS